MSHDRLYINDNYPLTTGVYGSDGVTPVLPISASIDIVDQITGMTIVTNGNCQVASGLATYLITSGSQVAQTTGRYLGYMRVQIDTQTAETIPLPFDVLDKGSYLVVERWRRKVEDSAPEDVSDDDEHGRDWIDQAVGWINKRYNSGYTSVLAVLSPVPTETDIEFIASVGSLLARSAWYAGRGSYRDDEISYDARAIQAEWAALDKYLESLNTSSLYDTIEDSAVTNKNRDGVFYRGRFYDEPDVLNDPYYDSWTTPSA